MSSLLYENQPKKKEDLLKLSEKLKFDAKKFEHDIDSSETSNELRREIDDAQKLEIDATPTMIINGEKVVGVKPYYELKEILESHGAEK